MLLRLLPVLLVGFFVGNFSRSAPLAPNLTDSWKPDYKMNLIEQEQRHRKLKDPTLEWPVYRAIFADAPLGRVDLDGKVDGRYALLFRENHGRIFLFLYDRQKKYQRIAGKLEGYSEREVYLVQKSLVAGQLALGIVLTATIPGFANGVIEWMKLHQKSGVFAVREQFLADGISSLEHGTTVKPKFSRWLNRYRVRSLRASTQSLVLTVAMIWFWEKLAARAAEHRSVYRLFNETRDNYLLLKNDRSIFVTLKQIESIKF